MPLSISTLYFRCSVKQEMNLYFSYLMIMIGTHLGSSNISFAPTSYVLNFHVPYHHTWPQDQNASLPHFIGDVSASVVNFASWLKAVD